MTSDTPTARQEPRVWLNSGDNSQTWLTAPNREHQRPYLPAAALDAAQSRIAELEAALVPFARYMQTDEGDMDQDNKGNPLPDDQGVGWIYLTHGDFRKARAALDCASSAIRAIDPATIIATLAEGRG